MTAETDPARDWPWAVIWFLIFFFAAWPVAFMCVFVYVLLLPFTSCVDGLKEPTEILLQIVTFPRLCIENMITLKRMCIQIEQ